MLVSVVEVLLADAQRAHDRELEPGQQAADRPRQRATRRPTRRRVPRARRRPARESPATCSRSRSSVSTRTRPMVRPCGAWNRPPIAWASECSAVQSEMFIVSPAIRLPHAISDRAAASWPSATAAGSERPISRIDSSAMASPIGVRNSRHHARDRLRQRVDPGVGGRRRRHGVREQRIDERVLRSQRRARDAGLARLARIADHRAAGDLGSGAGGGGHRDQWQMTVRGTSARTRGRRESQAALHR